VSPPLRASEQEVGPYATAGPSFGPPSGESSWTVQLYHIYDRARTAARVSAMFAPAPSAPLESGIRAFVEKLRKN